MPYLESKRYHTNYCDFCDYNLTGLSFWKVRTSAGTPEDRESWDYDACDDCKDAFVRQFGAAATVTRRPPDTKQVS